MKVFAFLLVVLIGAVSGFVAPSAFTGSAMAAPRATRGEWKTYTAVHCTDVLVCAVVACVYGCGIPAWFCMHGGCCLMKREVIRKHDYEVRSFFSHVCQEW